MNGAGLPPSSQGMCMCALHTPLNTAKVRRCAEPEVVRTASVLQLALAGAGREEFSVPHTRAVCSCS